MYLVSYTDGSGETGLGATSTGGGRVVASCP